MERPWIDLDHHRAQRLDAVAHRVGGAVEQPLGLAQVTSADRLQGAVPDVRRADEVLPGAVVEIASQPLSGPLRHRMGLLVELPLATPYPAKVDPHQPDLEA